MTQSEINDLAVELGCTPEKMPMVWESRIYCTQCDAYVGRARDYCKKCGANGYIESRHDCTLPDPLSDNPAAALWDGLFIRALMLPSMRWPTMCIGDNNDGVPEYKVNDIIDAQWCATVTAALHSAWLAKKARKA